MEISHTLEKTQKELDRITLKDLLNCGDTNQRQTLNKLWLDPTIQNQEPHELLKGLLDPEKAAMISQTIKASLMAITNKGEQNIEREAMQRRAVRIYILGLKLAENGYPRITLERRPTNLDFSITPEASAVISRNTSQKK